MAVKNKLFLNYKIEKIGIAKKKKLTRLKVVNKIKVGGVFAHSFCFMDIYCAG